MAKVNLVLFLTIEDEENEIGLMSPDRDLGIDLSDAQKSKILGIVADVLSNGREEKEKD